MRCSLKKVFQKYEQGDELVATYKAILRHKDFQLREMFNFTHSGNVQIVQFIETHMLDSWLCAMKQLYSFSKRIVQLVVAPTRKTYDYWPLAIKEKLPLMSVQPNQKFLVALREQDMVVQTIHGSCYIKNNPVKAP